MTLWDALTRRNTGLKKQPPDLDEVFKKLHNRLRQILSNTPAGGLKNRDKKNPAGTMLFLSAFLVLFLWAISGVFIVNPAERAAILRFGKYIKTVGPGPHWVPPFIESRMVRNVDSVSDYSYSAQMLTRDENLVSVALVVQYRIGDLAAYLFNVNDPQESLHQATSSALRQVVGTTTLDHMITEGREAWGAHVQESLNKILAQYKTGIVIVNVSPQPARAPDNVQDAFDDAIKAQEDEKRFKEQAYAYRAQVVPIAEGNAQRMLKEAKAYAEKRVLHAQGETAEFLALWSVYQKAPAVTASRMYLDTMQSVLTASTKVIVDSRNQNMVVLPLDKLLSPESSLNASATHGALQGSVPSAHAELPILLGNRPVTRPTYEQTGE